LVIDRYLYREFFKLLIPVLGLLAGIFLCITIIRVLNDAVVAQVGDEVILPLVGIHVLVAGETLLPTALYIAITGVLLRMHHDSEMVALYGTGFGEKRLLLPVLVFSVMVAIAVGILSLLVRPWAHTMRYDLEEQSIVGFRLRDVEAHRFMILGSFLPSADDSENPDLVLNASRVNIDTDELEDLFLFATYPDRIRLISAGKGRMNGTGEGRYAISMESGFAYQLDRHSPATHTYRFDTLDTRMDMPLTASTENRRTLSWTELASRTSPKEIAEFQWRLSMPLLTVLVGLLAVPISRTHPRRNDRVQRIFFAILNYALVFALATSGRSLVENRMVPPAIGIWWVWVLIGAWILVLFRRPQAL